MLRRAGYNFPKEEGKTQSPMTAVNLKALPKKRTKKSLALITTDISIAVDALCLDVQVASALSY
jgi:hypothetical protein